MKDIETMIQIHGNSIYRYALAITKHKDMAEDVFQEVFLRYFKRQPVFENESHEKAWFLKVCKNCSYTMLTSRFIQHTCPLEEDIPLLQKQENILYLYVMKLPLKYRSVIHLYYYEEYSTVEIAGLLHRKEATIRTQLNRARNILKKMIKEEQDEIL